MKRVRSAALLLVAIIPGSLYLGSSLRTHLEEQVESELFRHAGAVRETILLVPEIRTIAQADDLADRMAKAQSARVTLIASDGTVLGDSRISTDRGDA